jgi:hypothetical protein
MQQLGCPFGARHANSTNSWLRIGCSSAYTPATLDVVAAK